MVVRCGVPVVTVVFWTIPRCYVRYHTTLFPFPRYVAVDVGAGYRLILASPVRRLPNLLIYLFDLVYDLQTPFTTLPV